MSDEMIFIHEGRGDPDFVVLEDEAHRLLASDAELRDQLARLVRAGRDSQIILPRVPADFRQYASLQALTEALEADPELRAQLRRVTMDRTAPTW